MNEREDKKLGFIREIIGCLTSPRSSFKSILEKPSLMKATTLILMIAIIAAWASFNYVSTFPQQQRQGTPVNSEQLRRVPMISAIMTLISVFGTWLISSVLVHGFSSRLGGKGAFRSMLTLAGYASAPLIIQQLLRLVDSFMISQEELFQLTTRIQISVYPLLNSIANAAVDLFTIFRVWSIVLIILANRENYKMSITKSTVATVLSFIIVVFISALFPLT